MTPFKYLLLAATALPLATTAAPLTAEKLKLLSCLLTPSAKAEPVQGEAMRWLIVTTPNTDFIHYSVPGPTQFGPACLKNVKITALKTWSATGDICNTQLEEFTGAMSGIGVKLTSDSGDALLSSHYNGYQYTISKTSDTHYTYKCEANAP